MTATRVRTVAIAGFVCAAALSACTSSDDTDDPTITTPPTGTSSPAPGTSAPTSAPTSATSTPAVFGPVDGAYLVAGPTADDGDVYRVRSGRIVRVTTGAHVTSVTLDKAGTVVVGRENGDAELVQRLQDGRPADVGISAGFGPALAADGRLAWVSLAAAGTTPGVTKPGGFTVHVRPSATGADRDVATFTSSVGALEWTEDGILAAVAQGSSARLVLISPTGGTPRTLATVANGDDLALTAHGTDATLSSGDGAVVLTDEGKTSRPFPGGWTPLCWSDDDEVLATKGGQLGTVAISAAGTPATPRVLGSLPAGTSAYGGSCADD